MPKPLITTSQSLTQKEYRHHRAHAILGLYVICHFIYRYTIFFLPKKNDTDSYNAMDMGFNRLAFDNYNASTSNKTKDLYFILIFFPHLLLQISGLGFDIPKKRHPDGNRIWPQYRLEALVFFNRCIILLYIAWYRKYNESGYKNYDMIANYITVICTMILADSIRKYYQIIGEDSHTIRDLEGPPGVLYIMSSAQFHATLHSLMTKDKLSVQIAALTIVQISAFGMTLRRKGMITQRQGIVLYGFILVLGMIVILRDLQLEQILYYSISIGNITALLRFEFCLNKYFIWTIVFLFLLYSYSSVNEHSMIGIENVTFWIVSSVVSTFGLIFGAIKCQYKNKRKRNKKR